MACICVVLFVFAFLFDSLHLCIDSFACSRQSEWAPRARIANVSGFVVVVRSARSSVVHVVLWQKRPAGTAPTKWGAQLRPERVRIGNVDCRADGASGSPPPLPHPPSCPLTPRLPILPLPRQLSMLGGYVGANVGFGSGVVAVAARTTTNHLSQPRFVAPPHATALGPTPTSVRLVGAPPARVAADPPGGRRPLGHSAVGGCRKRRRRRGQHQRRHPRGAPVTGGHLRSLSAVRGRPQRGCGPQRHPTARTRRRRPGGALTAGATPTGGATRSALVAADGRTAPATPPKRAGRSDAAGTAGTAAPATAVPAGWHAPPPRPRPPLAAPLRPPIAPRRSRRRAPPWRRQGGHPRAPPCAAEIRTSARSPPRNA